VMDHAPHVGFVYAESEGDRRGDDSATALQKAALSLGSFRRVQSRVIKGGVEPARFEQLMDRRGLLAGAGVNDRRAVVARKQVKEPLVFRLAVVNAERLEIQPWTVKIGDDSPDVWQRERGDYVSLDFRRGRRGEREERGSLEFGQPRKHRPVMRSEIVPPLADAMRLVNDYERDLGLADELLEPRRIAALGRDVDQLIQPALDVAKAPPDLGRRKRAVQVSNVL